MGRNGKACKMGQENCKMYGKVGKHTTLLKTMD